MRSCACFVACWLLAQSFTTGGAVAQSVTLADVRQGLSDRERAFNNLSVTSRYEMVVRSPVTNEIVPLRWVETCTVDAQGRVRFEGVGESLSRGKSTPHRRAGAFDGRIARSISGAERYAGGEVSGNVADLGMRLSPWDMTTHSKGRPIREMLEQPGARVAGEADLDGRRVLVAETAPVTNDGAEWMARFWIDPSRGFSVPRKASLVRFAGDEWREYSVRESKNYKEISPGLWLPMSFEYEFLQLEPGKRPQLVWKWTVQNENWVVNANLADSVFNYEFPSGVFVDDKVTGRKYRVASVNNAMIHGAVSHARNLQAKLDQMPSGDQILGDAQPVIRKITRSATVGSRGGWIRALATYVTAGAVLAGVVFFVVRWRMARQR